MADERNSNTGGQGISFGGRNLHPDSQRESVRETGGTYSLEKMEDGEEVLIPNIKMPKTIDQSRLNRFGRERLKFLKENRENQYQSMYYKETLMEHLLNIEEQAQEFLEREEPKMMQIWGLTNELKSEDFLKHTGLKKNLDMTLTRMVLEQIAWA